MMNQGGVVIPMGMGSYAPMNNSGFTTTVAKDNGKRQFNFSAQTPQNQAKVIQPNQQSSLDRSIAV